MEHSGLHVIDLTIVLWYVVILLVIGLSFSSRTKTESELFLAGRRLTWPAIGFSLFASNISSTTIIGLAAFGYTYGVAASNYEWMATIILILGIFFFFPFYIKHRITTVPEFLEKRYDAKVRKYVSVFTILLSVVIDIAASLYAGALIIQVFYPNVQIWQTCMFLAVIAGIYTAAGGLAAVVYTDILQSVLVLIGCFILFLAVLGQYGFSWGNAVAHIDPKWMQMILPSSDKHLPWTGTLFGLPILGFYVWIINQYIVQRILAARSISHARWGAILGAGLKLTILFLMVMPGVLAIPLFPDLDNPDKVFPTLMTSLLPPGVLGLLLAAIIAAIMSSLDSALNSASTLIVNDFLKPSFPERSTKHFAKLGKYTTLILTIFAGVWAPFISRFEGIFVYVQVALAYLIPPIVVIFLGGFVSRRVSGKAAFRTLIVGHLLSIVFILWKMDDRMGIHYSVLPLILFILNAALLALMTYLYPNRDTKKLEDTTFYSNLGLQEKASSWYLDYRVQVGVLLVLTIGLILVFR